MSECMVMCGADPGCWISLIFGEDREAIKTNISNFKKINFAAIVGDHFHLQIDYLQWCPQLSIKVFVQNVA